MLAKNNRMPTPNRNNLRAVQGSIGAGRSIRQIEDH
jgi:hypothetical protein